MATERHDIDMRHGMRARSHRGRKLMPAIALLLVAVTSAAKTSPEWKAFSDNKTNIRVERQPIVADEILP